MRSIQRMIEISGGFAQLDKEPLDIDHKPYQRLIIEHVGSGPRQLPTIQVSQLFEREGGRQVLDSEMTFEIRMLSQESWIWLPVSFRQIDMPLFIQCAWVEPEGDMVFDKETAYGLTLIAEVWDEILVQRGYPGACGFE